MAAPIMTNIGIDTRVKSCRPEYSVSAATLKESKPWNSTRKPIPTAPSANATGAPVMNVRIVTTRTRPP
jgi:hypothetical protein